MPRMHPPDEEASGYRRRQQKLTGGPWTMLPTGGWGRASTFAVVPFGIALISLLWAVFWLDAGYDWWRTRGYVPAEGIVRTVALEEHRGRRGIKVWRPRVVVEYRREEYVGRADRLHFGGAKKSARDEAEALVAPYVVGSPARIWVDPADPSQAIIERRFSGGEQVLPGILPLVAAGWLGVACHFRPPNRPRATGDGTFAWTTRGVRLARVIVDAVIGISIVGAYLWIGILMGGWRGTACVACGLMLFGTWMLPIALSSIMRALLPRITATLTPAAGGWRLRYHVGGGLVRPRRIAVADLHEHFWTTGSSRTRKEHHATSHLRTLSTHSLLPAVGEVFVEVDLPTDAPSERRTRDRHFVIFRGGIRRWPDLHETIRLPVLPRGVERSAMANAPTC